jgi:hypothetical protein
MSEVEIFIAAVIRALPRLKENHMLSPAQRKFLNMIDAANAASQFTSGGVSKATLPALVNE